MTTCSEVQESVRSVEALPPTDTERLPYIQPASTSPPPDNTSLHDSTGNEQEDGVSRSDGCVSRPPVAAAGATHSRMYPRMSASVEVPTPPAPPMPTEGPRSRDPRTSASPEVDMSDYLSRTQEDPPDESDVIHKADGEAKCNPSMPPITEGPSVLPIGESTI